MKSIIRIERPITPNGKDGIWGIEVHIPIINPLGFMIHMDKHNHVVISFSAKGKPKIKTVESIWEPKPKYREWEIRDRFQAFLKSNEKETKE